MRIGFIGAGQMARALARGFVERRHLSAEDVSAADCSTEACRSFLEAVPGAQIAASNPELVRASEVVFLAVKPQNLSTVFQDLAPVAANRLIISVAAGVTLRQLAQGLGTERIARVMPNTPCLIGQGASGYCPGPGASEADTVLVGQLLDAIGISDQVPEPLLDVVTGLSGSGPAFVYQFIEALTDGGVANGLPRATAQRMAAQTVAERREMVLQSGEHPAVLRDRVASPGGTTIAGIEALERGAFRATVLSAVRSATERSRELADAAPAPQD